MADPEELAKQIREYSDVQLALAKADRPNSLRANLAEQELQRRERLQQHELARKLLLEQVQWMKFSAVVGLLGTIGGAIIGAVLAYWLQDRPSLRQPELQPRSTQQESVPSTSVDRKEKAESVPSKTP
jgi:hypothetical protein